MFGRRSLWSGIMDLLGSISCKNGGPLHFISNCIFLSPSFLKLEFYLSPYSSFIQVQVRLCLNLKISSAFNLFRAVLNWCKRSRVPLCVWLLPQSHPYLLPSIRRTALCTKKFRKIGWIKTESLFLGNLGWESPPLLFKSIQIFPANTWCGEW